MESPTQQDLDLIDSFPLTLFQLQADIREALDSLKEVSQLLTSLYYLLAIRRKDATLTIQIYQEYMMRPTY